MTHEDSLDLIIEVDAAAGVPVMLTAVNSRDVDIELQVQVCCMLLHEFSERFKKRTDYFK